MAIPFVRTVSPDGFVKPRNFEIERLAELEDGIFHLYFLSNNGNVRIYDYIPITEMKFEGGKTYQALKFKTAEKKEGLLWFNRDVANGGYKMEFTLVQRPDWWDFVKGEAWNEENEEFDKYAEEDYIPGRYNKFSLNYKKELTKEEFEKLYKAMAEQLAHMEEWLREDASHEPRKHALMAFASSGRPRGAGAGAGAGASRRRQTRKSRR